MADKEEDVKEMDSAQRRSTIFDLRARGLQWKTIANTLNISVRTAQRDYKDLREENLKDIDQSTIDQKVAENDQFYQYIEQQAMRSASDAQSHQVKANLYGIALKARNDRTKLMQDVGRLPKLGEEVNEGSEMLERLKNMGKSELMEHQQKLLKIALKRRAKIDPAAMSLN